MMFVFTGIIIIFQPVLGEQWTALLFTELSVICITWMCMLSTYWILRKTYEVGLDSVAKGPMDISSQLSSLPPLSLALRNSKATIEFIRFLVNEISVENIFFLSDIMAYKKTFLDRNALKSMGNGFECGVQRNLARLIYRRTFTHYAWAISKTYIDGSSSLFVTAISDDVRDDITQKLEGKDPSREMEEAGDESGKMELLLQELQNVFDEAAREVYDQLKRSYARFAYSPRFEKITQVLGGNQMI